MELFTVDLSPRVAEKLGRAKTILEVLFEGNEAKMARELAIPPSSLRRALRPEEQPDYTQENTMLERLDAVAKAVESRGLNTNWWETGEGQPFRSGVSEPLNGYDPIRDKREQGNASSLDPAAAVSDTQSILNTVSDGGLVRIEHVSVEVSGGNGCEVHFEEVEGETYLPAWYVRQEFGVSPERVKRIRVHGNSMKGTVDAGQLVYVVLMTPGQQPLHGGVYVLRGPHGLLIKRIYFEEDETGRWVRIHSDNPDAGTDRLPLDVFQKEYHPIAHFRSVQSYL